MGKKTKCRNYCVFVLALCAMMISGCSCSAPKPAPDPLEGWQKDYTPRPSDQIIEKDYKAYIHTLSADEQKFVAYVEYFEDGTGQHAVRITIGLNHTNWRHVLIYDKDNKRIKAIKYVSGNSMS